MDAAEQSELLTKLGAGSVVLAFIVMAIINALVSATDIVKFSNAEIANTHPVYGLPAGYAFSIWGIIYTLEGIFCVIQALPSGLASPEMGGIRPPVIGVFLTNSIWLLLFGWEKYWAAALVIVAYDLFLFQILQRLGVNFAARKHSWQVKLSAAAFAANASWVTVASCLQVQVNALEEGWLPSADFALGWLFGAVLLASTVVYRCADPVYAAVAAWALGGIIANQADTSEWGCNSQICPDCLTGIGICDRLNTSPFAGRPNGFAALQCDHYNSSVARVCVVDKSEVLVGWCYAFIGVVAAALVAGVARGLVLRAGAPHFSEMQPDTKEMIDDAEKGAPAPAL